MADFENPPQPDLFRVPPTQPGSIEAPPPPLSTWPTVLGVLAIVFGGFGILSGLLGIVAGFLLEAMISAMPPEQQPGMQIAQEFTVWTAGSSLISLFLAAFLLAVGTGIIKRSRWCLKAGITWAILKMTFAVANGVFMHKMMRVHVEAASQSPGMSAEESGMIAGMAAVPICLGWALPVFLLIWFSRAGIKEEVAGWR